VLPSSTVASLSSPCIAALACFFRSFSKDGLENFFSVDGYWYRGFDVARL
jgi:hypothetical protein